MGRVNEFERELRKRSKPLFARWHRVDLHNHSPVSFDYKYKGSDAAERTAEQVLKTDLSVVMFTDHATLPDPAFTSEVSRLARRLIFRGVELNVFVNVLGGPPGKISKNIFYYLLIGFDPSGPRSPEYWLEEVYRKCNEEKRMAGTLELRGVSAPVSTLLRVLEEANAIVIPAHVHSTDNVLESRGIDDIFEDQEFLKDVEAFTAPQVRSKSTAKFFDGTRTETNNIEKTCIVASDSHEPDRLGSRPCYLQMADVSYAELKAALEVRCRASIDPVDEPASHIIGMHVAGEFLRDTWLSLSPNCNVFIGVKGSGKTSVLECLRFVLGSDVPAARAESVKSHLSSILGPAGRVRVLLRRADGAKVLVERSLNDLQFVLTFEDDRVERMSSAAGHLFSAQVLGWHEIEQVVTDVNSRRAYLDTIAGKEAIRVLEERVESLGKRIRERHALASERYATFRDLHQRVARLQELRRGLLELREARLVELRDQYQAAVDHREALRAALKRLKECRDGSRAYAKGLLGGVELAAPGADSPLKEAVSEASGRLNQISNRIDQLGEVVERDLDACVGDLERTVASGEGLFASFVEEYTRRINELPADRRVLLETHREVLERTRELGTLEVDQEAVKGDVQRALDELKHLCEEAVALLDERTALRSRKVDEFNAEIQGYGVRLTVIPQQPTIAFEELRRRYGEGARAMGELRSKFPERLGHLCLIRAYSSFYGGLSSEYGFLFEHGEVGHFLSSFEDDDLRIEFKVDRAGQEYRAIDQLSAGQRCTAMFPILLKLREGPLIIDQPEDNLDNRHIATTVTPILLDDKRTRQMVFTSHNANLVVLSDPELIVAVESDGSTGRVEEDGFLATRESSITRHVLEIVDGGERALEMRFRKYRGTRP